MIDIEFKIQDKKQIKEFTSKLIPIGDWEKVEPGTKIFFEGTNHPSYCDEFISIFEPEDRNLVEYKAVSFDQGKYLMRSNGWYYWNEEIANMIINTIEYNPYKHNSEENILQ